MYWLKGYKEGGLDKASTGFRGLPPRCVFERNPEDLPVSRSQPLLPTCTLPNVWPKFIFTCSLGVTRAPQTRVKLILRPQ